MPRVPVHTMDSAPEASRDVLKRLEGKYGKVINVFGEMAHSPALLHLYDAAEGALTDEATFDAATQQAIHLTVAAVNECAYCQSAYTGGAKKAGLSEEQTVQIRAGHLDDDAKLTALLQLSREIADRRGYVADETWQSALDAGWRDDQLLEAYGHVVRTILTNYFNHFVGTEIDLPLAPGLA